MSFNEIADTITNYIHVNPPGAIAAGVILLFLLFRKPKVFVTLLLICVAGIGIMMIFDKISSTGVSYRDLDSWKEFK